MTPFDVTCDDLGCLNSYEAVRVFHALLFAEAAWVEGIDDSKIDVPISTSAINTPDGGVDAEVSDAHPGNGSHGIIKEGRTSYQIKSGNIDIRNLSDAKAMVSAGGGLSPRVCSCIAEGGTYVIVLFGSDKPDSKDGKSVSLVRQAIDELAPDLKGKGAIEVWRQNKLCGFLANFPPVSLLAKGDSSTDLHTMATWESLGDMRKRVCFGPVQEEAIATIRDAVLSSPMPIRVIGDPGVGKTRLVMEALRVERLASTVVYASKPSDIPPGFLRELSQPGSRYHCVLVVDECPKDVFRDIWNQLDGVSDRVRLISIYNTAENPEPNLNKLDIAPLAASDVAKIITAYGVPEDKASWAAKLCGGSPRVAHIISEQMQIFGTINITSYEDVWRRYVANRDEVGSELYAKRLRALEWLSLFARFGYNDPFAEEGDQVVRKIAQATGMCTSEVREVISDLCDRKILQGDRTLYITPKLLHLWLWANWWKKQGAAFTWSKFMTIDESGERFCDSLVFWFIDMLQYARESTVASKVTKGLLGSNGPFSDASFITTSRGFRLMSAIADVNPETALDYIEALMRDLDDADLHEFKRGRRCLVGTLKRTAFETHLFDRSARLLLRLACAENEGWANNATGEFADLFSMGYGRIAPTKTPPAQRFPVLRDAALSNSSVTQRVAIKAMGSGLRQFTSRAVGVSEADHLREPMQGWMPVTYGELWDGFRNVWTLGMECLAKYEGGNREKLAGMLQSRAVGLLVVMGDGSEPAGWLKDLYATGYADVNKLLNDLARLLRYSTHLSNRERELLESLKGEIGGSCYEARIHRYVGVRVWAEELGDDEDESSALAVEIDDLSLASIQQPDKFEALLPWLVSKQPDNAYRFGVALGNRDTFGSLWPLLFHALRDAPAGERGSQLCSGYLSSVYRRDRSRWETAIAELREDDRLASLLPSILSDEGISDETLGMLVSLFVEGRIPPDALKPLGFCSHRDSLSDESVCRLLNVLVDAHAEDSASLAIEIAFRQIQDGRVLPADDLAKVISQPELFSADVDAGGFLPYIWSEIANAYLDSYPDEGVAIVDAVVECLGCFRFGGLDDLAGTLCRLVQREPEDVWNAIGERLLDGERFFSVDAGVGEIAAAVAGFPVKTVLSWIDKDPDRRAYLALECFPASLYDEGGRSTITREIVAKYGDRESVQGEMWAKAHELSGIGSLVDYYDGKIAELETYREREKNPHVLTYIDRAIPEYQQEQEKERIREERMGW